MKLTALLVTAFCLVAMNQARAEEAKAPAAEAPKAEAKVEKTETKVTKKETKKEKKTAKAVKPVKRADGLVIEDEVVGTGKEAKLGSKITVHYRGTFTKGGAEFDSSYKRNEPITFELLEGRLIKGWTEGIPGMKVGGKRKLHVPYALAYGETGTPGGPIGPKADLDFEVELKDVN